MKSPRWSRGILCRLCGHPLARTVPAICVPAQSIGTAPERIESEAGRPAASVEARGGREAVQSSFTLRSALQPCASVCCPAIGPSDGQARGEFVRERGPGPRSRDGETFAGAGELPDSSDGPSPCSGTISTRPLMGRVSKRTLNPGLFSRGRRPRCGCRG